LSIALAWLTYKLIEKPLRFGSGGVTKTICLILLMVGVGIVGYSTYVNNGLIFRGPSIAGKEAGNDGGYPVKLIDECGLSQVNKSKFSCLKDSRLGVKYALLGDSKAEAIFSGLIRTSYENARWLMIAKGSQATPVPLISDSPAYTAYQPAIAMAVDAINANEEIENVVLLLQRGIYSN